MILVWVSNPEATIVLGDSDEIIRQYHQLGHKVLLGGTRYCQEWCSSKAWPDELSMDEWLFWR